MFYMCKNSTYGVARLMARNDVDVNVHNIASGQSKGIADIVLVLVSPAQEQVAVIVAVNDLHRVLDGTGNV